MFLRRIHRSLALWPRHDPPRNQGPGLQSGLFPSSPLSPLTVRHGPSPRVAKTRLSPPSNSLDPSRSSCENSSELTVLGTASYPVAGYRHRQCSRSRLACLFRSRQSLTRPPMFLQRTKPLTPQVGSVSASCNIVTLPWSTTQILLASRHPDAIQRRYVHQFGVRSL